MASRRSTGIGDALLEAELLFELVATETKRPPRFRSDFGLEFVDIRAHSLTRFGLRVGEFAKQMQVVDIRERARQIVVDERQRTAHRLDAHLDEDAGRFLDVVAGGLNQPRRLTQLGKHAPCAFGRGSVGEEDLAGKTRRDQVGIVLRVTLPRADFFELEDAALDVGGQHAVVEPLHRRQRFAV